MRFKDMNSNKRCMPTEAASAPRRTQQEQRGGICCCFWCHCPSPALQKSWIRQERKGTRARVTQTNCGKTNRGLLRKNKNKKKILLPFEPLWGHWEHASKLFCSALRDGKLLLIQENKALHCHYQQKKLKRLWTLCSRQCGSKEKSLQPSQDLATPGPCQQSALTHYCKSQAEPSLLRNLQLWLLGCDK